MEYVRVGVDAVLLVVDVVLLRFRGPWIFADHVEVGLGGLLKLFVLFEGVLFKAVDVPGEQFEHVGVLLAVLGGLAEGLLWEVDLVGGLTPPLL